MSFFVVVLGFILLSVILIALSSLQLHITNFKYSFGVKRRELR